MALPRTPRIDFLRCVTRKTVKDDPENSLVCLDFYKDAEDALRTVVEAQEKDGFLTNDLRDTVQRWVDLSGDSDLVLTKDQISAIKNNDFLDTPPMFWWETRKSPQHYWFLTAWVEIEG